MIKHLILAIALSQAPAVRRGTPASDDLGTVVRPVGGVTVNGQVSVNITDAGGPINVNPVQVSNPISVNITDAGGPINVNPVIVSALPTINLADAGVLNINSPSVFTPDGGSPVSEAAFLAIMDGGATEYSSVQIRILLEQILAQMQRQTELISHLKDPGN